VLQLSKQQDVSPDSSYKLQLHSEHGVNSAEEKIQIVLVNILVVKNFREWHCIPAVSVSAAELGRQT